MTNEKILKYQNKIFNQESKFNIYGQINMDELEKFKTKLSQYKITTNILFSDPNFYLDLKFIELDQSIGISEYICKEIVWINEHYDFIEQIRTIESDIKFLITKSYKFGLISNVQYKLVKKFFTLVKKIYETDTILKDLYVNSKKNKKINLTQLNFYFDILEIILLKIKQIEFFLYNKSTKIELLLENKNYINNIAKLKTTLELSMSEYDT